MDIILPFLRRRWLKFISIIFIINLIITAANKKNNNYKTKYFK